MPALPKNGVIEITMLFNSLDFAIFLPIVFVLYWVLLKNSLRLQNLLIVIASYVFYGWWDWRFLSLIFFSTLVDYIVANRIRQSTGKSQRKRLLAISLICNLGLLGFLVEHLKVPQRLWQAAEKYMKKTRKSEKRSTILEI